MADPTFIGNWNLFMGPISDEEGIRVPNSTWKIEPGNDGYVKVEMSTGERAGLRLSNASGYLEATGSTPNWFTNNYIFLVLSQDGSMFHGAVKQSENDPPLPGCAAIEAHSRPPYFRLFHLSQTTNQTHAVCGSSFIETRAACSRYARN